MPESFEQGRCGLARGPKARLLAIAAVALASLAASTAAAAQPVPERNELVNPQAHPPFSPGERLQFQVHSSRFGRLGSGFMSVEGPVDVRGQRALLLSMEVEGQVILFSFEDRTRSWFDPSSGASLRFHKRERHPLARRSESVEVLVSEGRWQDADGDGGPLPSTAPLDELSVIYFLRTLELDQDDPLTLHRHFDEERNPIQIRRTGTETITVPAGTFDAVIVELEVRDPRRYDEESNTIRIHFARNEQRIPLRIESQAPGVGTLVMTLEHWRPGDGTDLAKASPQPAPER